MAALKIIVLVLATAIHTWSVFIIRHLRARLCLDVLVRAALQFVRELSLPLTCTAIHVAVPFFMIVNRVEPAL